MNPQLPHQLAAVHMARLNVNCQRRADSTLTATRGAQDDAG